MASEGGGYSLALLCVGLPHAQVKGDLLEPICRFKDDAFHDAASSFLHGFDRAILALNTREPEDPASVRVLVSDRRRRSRAFRSATREKGTTVEGHFGDAVMPCSIMDRIGHGLHDRTFPSTGPAFLANLGRETFTTKLPRAPRIPSQTFGR